MAPRDLLVKSGGAVARLRRSDMIGSRVTRHGYFFRFKEVLGSAHRHLKHDLEARRDENGVGLAHLCSTSPCPLHWSKAPGKTLRVCESAPVDRGLRT